MKTRKKNYRSGSQTAMLPRRPSIFTLIFCIARAALTGGGLGLLFFGGALAAFLHIMGLPADTLLVLLIFTAITSAIVRGINVWRDDVKEYQRTLAEYRTLQEHLHQVKKDIAWDRQ